MNGAPRETVRVAVVHSRPVGGGAERHALQLVEAWVRMPGVDAEVVFLEGASFDVSMLPRAVPTWQLGSTVPDGWVRQISWLIRSLFALVGRFRHGGYDAVISFLWVPTLLAVMARKLLPRSGGSPVVHMWALQSGLEEAFALRSAPKIRALAARWTARNVDRLFATSTGHSERSASFLRVDPERFEIVPNSVDVDHFSTINGADASPAWPANAAARLVAVGRLHPQKGFDQLLDALSLLRARGITNWHCNIVGDGEQADDLYQRRRALGLQDHVTFVGSVPDPKPWLVSSDIFVLPSRWEPFGLAIIEAMAAGLPVVVSATDGPLDVVDDHVDGLLVAVGEAEDLADGLEKLILDPGLRRQLGVRGRIKATHYSPDRIAEIYWDLLRDALAR